MRTILKALGAALLLCGMTLPSWAALLVTNTAPPAVPAPAMWEVRDADSKIWLFGSVHILPAGLNWRTPLFNRTVESAGQVYFETDVGPLGMVALTIKMVALGFQTLNTSWVKELTPEQLAQLTAAIKPLGYTLEQVNSYPPWVLDLQLNDAATSADVPADKRPDLASGVDPSLQWELPKERKAYLETPGQQFDFLASDPLDVQIRRLFADINAPAGESASGQLDELVGHWIAGDVDFLAQTVAGVGPDEAALEKRILYDRNSSWIPTLERLLADNKEDLIVVGAAHLAGPGSVLDLLAKAGYTVTRVQ